jgi:hypothetical protein
MLVKTCGVVLASWLFASIVEAAPPAHHLAFRRPCDPHSTSLLKLLRYPKAHSPLAKTRRARTWLVFDLAAAHLHRNSHSNPGADDDAAIQNDTAATSSHDEGSCAPSLRSLGIVNAALGGRPLTRAFSPRSPRGPPFSV